MIELRIYSNVTDRTMFLSHNNFGTKICNAMLSMQTLLNYCYCYCAGWTTRLHHIDANLHFATLFLFWLFFFSTFSFYFFHNLLSHLPYTPFYCGVTDGGWSTWPNLVFYLARVFFLISRFSTSPSFIASLNSIPVQFLGGFLAIIL